MAGFQDKKSKADPVHGKENGLPKWMVDLLLQAPCKTPTMCHHENDLVLLLKYSFLSSGKPMPGH